MHFLIIVERESIAHLHRGYIESIAHLHRAYYFFYRFARVFTSLSFRLKPRMEDPSIILLASIKNLHDDVGSARSARRARAPTFLSARSRLSARSARDISTRARAGARVPSLVLS